MNPREVMAWLESGRTDEARTALAARFGHAGSVRAHRSMAPAGAADAPTTSDPSGPVTPGDRLAFLLYRVLESRGEDRQAPTPADIDPGTGGRQPSPSAMDPADSDLSAAIHTLEQVMLASSALRSGRIPELLTATRAALGTAPSSMTWLVFQVGSLLQACYRFTGQREMRLLALDVCGRVADRVALPHLALPARGLMGNIHMMHGAFHRAFEHCDAALALADATGLEEAPAVAMAHQFRGYVLFEWNRLAEAEASLRRAWDVARSSRGVRSGVARMMARVRTAVGDEVGAERWLDRLETVVAEPMTLRNREWLASVRVRQTLGPGHLRAVEEWLRTYDYRPATLAAFEPAELHARLHELDQVLALLEATEQWSVILDLAPRIESVGRAERCWFAARAASAEAVALEAAGRTEDADARFAHALALGEEGSFVRVYTEGSALRSRLLERAAQHGERAALRVLRETSPAPAATLTVAQHAVLERVASGASNKAIARGLGVSLSTVKTHLRAIFARLDVSSRTQAVAKAREIGILAK